MLRFLVCKGCTLCRFVPFIHSLPFRGRSKFRAPGIGLGATISSMQRPRALRRAVADFRVSIAGVETGLQSTTVSKPIVLRATVLQRRSCSRASAIPFLISYFPSSETLDSRQVRKRVVRFRALTLDVPTSSFSRGLG